MYKRPQRGFTIVELLIVIVVIAVLATIIAVSYNGIQKRARNAVRLSDMTGAQKLLQSYVALNGALPALADGNYCLGAGYKDFNGDNTPDCNDVYYDPNRGAVNEELSAALATVGTMPTTDKPLVIGNYVGPVLSYQSGGNEWMLYQWFEGNNAEECPIDSEFVWGSSGAILCQLEIPHE